MVWLPDASQVWVKADIVSSLTNGKLVVRRHNDGREETLLLGPGDALPALVNPAVLLGTSDLTSLSYLHEPAGEGGEG